MPPMDQSFPVLLEDLHDRGLLDSTLVVWAGEFGRTPKLEYVSPHPAPGRNHWGNCFSVALAGAGVRGGVVHGASDKDGAYPREVPVGPADLTATLYHLLGVAPETEVRDHLDRPHPVSRGRVLERLF
jgi:arylsulfatase A-like enzyme